jgi:flagellar motor component MotA
MSHHHNHSHSHNHDNEGKTVKEKLQILVKHWKEHNDSHIDEYKRWENKAREEGLVDVAEILREVCDKLDEVTRLYEDIEKIVN